MTEPSKSSEYLSIMTRAEPEAIKQMAETLIPALGDVKVLKNQTGLVMLPYTDSAQGTVFHLGEVLVSEAHVSLDSGAQGYAMCVGRDAEQAVAIALIDAAITAAINVDAILAFLAQQQQIIDAQEQELLHKVEATRVEMETL